MIAAGCAKTSEEPGPVVNEETNAPADDGQADDGDAGPADDGDAGPADDGQTDDGEASQKDDSPGPQDAGRTQAGTESDQAPQRITGTEELVTVYAADSAVYEFRTVKNSGISPEDISTREGSYGDLTEGLAVILKGRWENGSFYADNIVMMKFV